jgi:hypothetical protein
MTSEHPPWCVRHFCTANPGRSGAHRGRPIVLNEEPLRITASLYSDAALPDDVLIELTKNSVRIALLPAGVAHALGRALATLGTATEGLTDQDDTT